VKAQLRAELLKLRSARTGLGQLQTPGSDWSEYVPDSTYVGSMPGGMRNGIDWTVSVWSRLWILDPWEPTASGCP
jgi:hypothetical protein